jgi:hypothetical protein
MAASEGMAPKPARILDCPMEIASRELDSRLRLAAIAARRRRNIEYMTPGVYLSRTLTARDAKMLAPAKAAGYTTAAIDEEIPGRVVHDIGSVEARLDRYARPLNLDVPLKVEACGSKAILLSPRPLALGTRMRRAIGRWQVKRMETA